MEHHKNLWEEANQKLKTADHLLTTTYSLVKEPKLLISAVEKICESLDIMMSAAIEHENIHYEPSKESDQFNEKFEIFRRKIATKYGIGNDTLEFIAGIKKTFDEHKKSEVEFIRKDKFIITDKEYNIMSLNLEAVKKDMAGAKHHMQIIIKTMRL